MLKNRLIAVILLRNGQVVQSVKFKHTNIIHYDPVHAIESFNRWAVDEIVLLNVSRDVSTKDFFVDIVKRLSKECFVPMTAGGWINDIAYARALLANGADKIIVNTDAYRNPDLISILANKFGRQCVVVSIDAKQNSSGESFVVIDRGSDIQQVKVGDWAQKAEQKGAGELFINSLDHDGNRKGYHIPLIRQISSLVSIPVVAMGGVFHWQDLVDGIQRAKADAVAAANIFHYTEHSTKKAKQYLAEVGLNVRQI
ncbi:MAG: imidazole glycerol phosphate synthase subunit HisF [Desulfobacteraceae bacterium]|nr:imidazole glycerol phosphate synthase subunit HisF [Desulfobacteraceae bacterium]